MSNGDSKSRTIAEIMAKRDAAVANIQADAQTAQDKQLEIQARAAAQNRDLTASEIAEFERWSTAIDVLSKALVEIKFVAVDEAIQSQEAKDLAQSLDAVNKELKQKLAHVADISQKLTKLSQLFANLQSIVSGLTRLAALV